ncbi:MAG: MFS transporter [Nitrososphaeria archaeon]
MIKNLQKHLEDFRLLNLFANVYFAIFEFALGLYVIYLGGNSLDVGIAYAVYNVSWIAFMPFSRSLSSSANVRRSLLAGFLILFLGLFTFSVFKIPDLYLSVFLMGFSSSIVSASMLYLVGFSGGYRDANAYAQLMYYGILGSGIGAFIGFIFFLYSQFSGRYVFSLRITFLIYSFMVLVAVILAAKIRISSINAVYYEIKERESGSTILHLLILASTAFLGIGQGIVYPMIVPFVVTKYRTTPLILMLAYAPAGIGWFISSKIAGPVINRFSESRSIAFITLTSSIIAFLLPLSPDLIVLSILWGIEAVGLSIWTVYMQHMVAKYMPSERWGTGFGSLNSMYYLSYAVGSISGSSLYFFRNPFFAFWTGGLFFLLIPVPVVLLLSMKNNKKSALYK